MTLLCDAPQDDHPALPCPQHAVYGTSRCLQHQHPTRERVGTVHVRAMLPLDDTSGYPLAADEAAESTAEPETVQTPAENESPDEEEPLPDDGLGTFYIATRQLTPQQAFEIETKLNDLLAQVGQPEPLPPSRRGWRRFFRRAA